MLVWFCGDLRARKRGTTYDDGPLMQRMQKTRDASATFMVVSSDTVVVLEVIVWRMIVQQGKVEDLWKWTRFQSRSSEEF
jgi:hypothetical protein